MKKLIIAMLGLMAMTTARGAGLISVAPCTIEQGAQSELSIVLTNGSMSVNTIGLSIYLPDALEFVLTDGQISGTLTSRAVDHTLSGALQPDGSGYYLLMSMTNAALKGTDGAIFTIPVKAVGDPGTCQVMLNNIEVVDADLQAHRTDDDTYFDVAIAPAEEVRYGDNQLYVKDITINQGENATMQVCYNSASDVHEYSAAITLPAGVISGAVTYAPVLTSVNYTTHESVAGQVLTLTGSQSGTPKKPKPAEGGNQAFAEVALNTAGLGAGVYDIVVGDQYLSNEDEENAGEYNPASYTARLTVVATTPAVTSMDFADGDAYDGDTDYYDIDVTYTRKFGTLDWQAIYVPFNMAYDEWSPYANVAEVHNVRGYDYDDDGMIDEIFIEFNRLGPGAEMVPNVPYVIRAKAKGTFTFECTGKTVLAAPAADEPIECSSTKFVYSFHGVYHKTTGLYEQGAYRLTGGAFAQYATANGSLGSNRFYMLVTPKTGGYNTGSLPKTIKIRVNGDDTESIQAIEADAQDGGACYDLLGRKVANPGPGIYIKNGKKILIK